MSLTLVNSDGSSVRIASLGVTNEGRQAYGWDVYANVAGNSVRIAGGTDINSGVGASVDLWSAHETFASFVGAWIESFGYPGSDNADLFPDAMRNWAEQNADELYRSDVDEF